MTSLTVCILLNLMHVYLVMLEAEIFERPKPNTSVKFLLIKFDLTKIEDTNSQTKKLIRYM